MNEFAYVVYDTDTRHIQCIYNNEGCAICHSSTSPTLDWIALNYEVFPTIMDIREYIANEENL